MTVVFNFLLYSSQKSDPPEFPFPPLMDRALPRRQRKQSKYLGHLTFPLDLTSPLEEKVEEGEESMSKGWQLKR